MLNGCHQTTAEMLRAVFMRSLAVVGRIAAALLLLAAIAPVAERLDVVDVIQEAERQHDVIRHRHGDDVVGR